jgi:hypothetical protein
MLWHLGSPENYLKDLDHDIAQDGFMIVISRDGDHGRELELIDDGKNEEMPLSVLQVNAMRKLGSVEML